MRKLWSTFRIILYLHFYNFKSEIWSCLYKVLRSKLEILQEKNPRYTETY